MCYSRSFFQPDSQSISRLVSQSIIQPVKKPVIYRIFYVMQLAYWHILAYTGIYWHILVYTIVGNRLERCHRRLPSQSHVLIYTTTQSIATKHAVVADCVKSNIFIFFRQSQNMAQIGDCQSVIACTPGGYRLHRTGRESVG